MMSGMVLGATLLRRADRPGGASDRPLGRRRPYEPGPAARFAVHDVEAPARAREDAGLALAPIVSKAA